MKDSSIELRIECRRTLYQHARLARARGWSVDRWEKWARSFATGLVEAIGPHELACLVSVVWRLK